MSAREKLVKLLSNVSCNGNGEALGSCPDRKYGLCGETANLSYCVIQNTVNHLIANGVTLQEWIPVAERLPADSMDVLVRLPSGDCAVAAKFGPFWYKDWSGARMARNPTHWMPLPPPTKEGTP